jgi:signal transduction histidine kinase
MVRPRGPSFSINTQLLFFVGFFALTLLGFWFFSSDLSKTFITELTIQTNQEKGRKLLDDISRQINISLREMRLLARRPMILSALKGSNRLSDSQQKNDQEITEYLIDTYKNRYFIDFGYRLFRDILILDQRKRQIAYSELPNPAYLQDFLGAADPGEVVLRDVEAYGDSSFSGLGIIVPILDEDSELLGHLMALMDLGAILSQMDLQLNLDTRLEILQANGNVLYSNGVFQLLAPSQYLPQITGALEMESSQVDNTLGYLFTLSQIKGHGIFSGFGWKLLLITDLDSVLAPVNNLAGLNTTLFLAVLLFSLIMAYLFSRSIVRPLLDFQAGAQELGAGNLDYRFSGSITTEINDLARVFNTMSANLQQSYTRLQVKESQAKELAKNLEESNRDLEEFAYIASHDLQEPLRKVIAYGELLREEHQEHLPEEGQYYIGVMQNAAERMSKLIANLLEYSRLSSKSLSPDKQSVEEIIQEAKDNLSLIIQEKKVRFDEPKDYPFIIGQRKQLVHLFQNLISNGIKYQSPGQKPRIRISFTRLPEEGMIEFKVADNGIGVDQEYFQEIFKPFKRLHGKGAYSGSGIGLSICRKVVQRHGGEIRIQSQAGQGATLVFTLPAAPGKLVPIAEDNRSLTASQGAETDEA